LNKRKNKTKTIFNQTHEVTFNVDFRWKLKFEGWRKELHNIFGLARTILGLFIKPRRLNVVIIQNSLKIKPFLSFSCQGPYFLKDNDSSTWQFLSLFNLLKCQLNVAFPFRYFNNFKLWDVAREVACWGGENDRRVCVGKIEKMSEAGPPLKRFTFNFVLR